MKRWLSLALSLALACAFAVSTLQAAGREDKRLQQGKITKNEAQHLVLKKFPGATIKKCELRNVAGNSVWAVELMTSGSQSVTKVQVDGRTGKIAP